MKTITRNMNEFDSILLKGKFPLAAAKFFFGFKAKIQFFDLPSTK